MENDVLKQAAHGTNVNVIRNNAHKYSVSEMGNVLQISRSSYYYQAIKPASEGELVQLMRNFFQKLLAYGTHKLKVELEKKDWANHERTWAYIEIYCRLI